MALGCVARDGHHECTGQHVEVTPDPERWREDGDLLASVQWQVGAVVHVGAEGLLGSGEDTCPWSAVVLGDPVANLVVGCAVALRGPRVSSGTGQVPDTAFGNGVGEGEYVFVDGGAVGFGCNEDEGAVEVDPVQC